MNPRGIATPPNFYTIPGQNKKEAQSWGELLNMYREERITTRQDILQPEPIFRQTRERSYVWRHKEREINPVLQHFIDPVKEEKYKDFEKEQTVQTMNRGMDRTLMLESQFDIVTMKDKRRLSFDEISFKKIAPYFHPGNHDEKGKKIDPAEFKPSESKELIDRNTRKKKFLKDPKTFDEIFLRYYQKNSEELLQNDLKKQQDSIKAKYSSHIVDIFHPILQHHVDDNKEKRERE